MKSILAVLALALLTAGCGDSAPSAEAQTTKPAALPADVRSVEGIATPEPPATSTAAPVVDGEVAGVADGALAANGEFVSPAQSSVAPKIPGRVARVLVDEGARVAQGQPLAALETDYLRLDVQRAEAELARVSAAFAEAERDLGRKEELRQKESVPQATYDRSRGAFEQARAGKAAADAGVRMARQRLADSVIRSPLAGVVSERKTDAGEFLGEGGVAFIVIQTAPLKLRFRVPEKYLGRIRAGQSVVATVDPYPGEKFAGTIKTVGGVIDPQTRTLFAEAEFPNRDGRLQPGLFARVEAQLP
ncbi:MAG TPA: efflux RND transporter periplasmic adaptor subunit [Thermoanaerobaculia bacterium]|nr:efflux RND transporter periplasmic adaptor subunit [Thermoanaerobaculia bacterium]